MAAKRTNSILELDNDSGNTARAKKHRNMMVQQSTQHPTILTGPSNILLQQPMARESSAVFLARKIYLAVTRSGESSLEKKTLKAEVMVTNVLLQHNLPIATADHLGPLFGSIFPDLIVDVLWSHIANLKIPGTNVPRFSHLFKVAEIILVLRHSNSEEERLFSIVRKNKTDSCSSLKLDGTLSSILAMKSRFQE
eukprot:gene2539-2936_t